MPPRDYNPVLLRRFQSSLGTSLVWISFSRHRHKMPTQHPKNSSVQKKGLPDRNFASHQRLQSAILMCLSRIRRFRAYESRRYKSYRKMQIRMTVEPLQIGSISFRIRIRSRNWRFKRTRFWCGDEEPTGIFVYDET